MKEFLDNLGKVISEKAEVVTKKAGEVVEVVAQKTEETVEVTKIKNQIHVMEKNNDRDFRDIGKMVYDKFKNGHVEEEQYAELCEAIAEREECIEKSKQEILKIKGMDICDECGSRLDASAQFCPKCGTKVE